jgi:Na+/melibiose symporter-like transporter
VHYGLGWALTIDAISYVVSAVALLALHHRPAPREHHEAFARMLRDGLGYLRGNASVAGFGIVSVMPFVATISLNVVFVSYVLDVMHRSATVYGLTDMMYGAGALASGFLAALLVIRLGEWSSMLLAIAVLVCGYLALAAGPATVAGLFALAALVGFCSSGFRVISNSVLLRVVPNVMMGRTSATISLVSVVMQVVVTLAVGPIVNHAGARGGFVMLACIVAAAGVALVVLLPRMRALPRAVPEGG